MRYIKTTLACLTITGSLLSFTAHASSELKGCAAKEHEIQQQIDYATSMAIITGYQVSKRH
ncbi:hypothetical protein [Klebsiella oxytoca]|uniref:hypothetical protein n=1 Tax=Klebsiella oxytoca TaxID=571 RepID=UPI003F66D860